MRKIANCIHHTHWDLIWYFTVQDATVQFAYNMKELLKGFNDNRIIDFFLDGQTAPLDEYLQLYPEDKSQISELVKAGKLIIGPFNSQLDSFICSGESIVNNLRLGIETAKRLGKISRVAYLPDSFGHSSDYPKIFNQFNIKDFVITRGVGDEYGVGSEFYLKSIDGSKVLVCTMIAGYGYGCYAFRNGTLFDESAQDYNKISVKSLIERLLSYSTIKNEFVFPLGFDQNPVMLDINKRIDYYNKNNKQIHFKYTSWQKYCDHVRKEGKGLKTYTGELNSPQYHRIHRSIFSGRADIKNLQDECERKLTYELQPLSSISDTLGIEYSHALINSDWERLVKCQTHSSANLTDETNNYILRETKNVLNQIKAHINYLYKLMSISLGSEYIDGNKHPLLIFNTLPYQRNIVYQTKILVKTSKFNIFRGTKGIHYVVLKTVKKNCGVLRKDKALIDHSKDYYEIDVLLEICNVKGFSYEVLTVEENINSSSREKILLKRSDSIENNYYNIQFTKNGISVTNKLTNQTIEKAIYLEDSGDEGDSFDYSYPDNDYIIRDYFENSDVRVSLNSLEKRMTLRGSIKIPKNIANRESKKFDSKLSYQIVLTLKEQNIVEVEGTINNAAKAHRVRLCFSTNHKNTNSYAGTQYGYIKRDVWQKSMKYWKVNKWFEEPSATWPLLNYVTACNDNDNFTVYTKSSKEYEFIGNNYQDIAVTIFRSYGAMGYPDLNRRPGRPSGLDYKIFETKDTQMIGNNCFKLGFTHSKYFDPNQIVRNYVEYAIDEMSFEGQSFDKSLETILYFPTNPLSYKLPKHFSMLQIDKFDASYGTLVKDDDSEGYILRLFNSKHKATKIGKIKSNISWKIDEVKLSGDVIKPEMTELPELKKGQLINIRITKGGVTK
jgi:mannosylglycerate hydrolase